ncbi:hypothetical protein GCM10009775_20890 [Microbacterium aoyamense]|uniref:Uncharacterized protein n=1 Tax=Microbacterium aoyamense TaxID=344166 RepID=A0ABP5B2T7_9MICO|nr:alpha/beta fold hydrolase [Microbacterium aoyamense]
MAALFGIACLVPAGPAAAAPVDEPLGFVEGRCPAAVPESRLDDVRCGSFVVPERRADGSDPDRKVSLPVIVIVDESADHATDALFVPVSATAGGSSLDALASFLARPTWVGPRDVVLVDQRGDLHAEPSLDCPEVEGRWPTDERLEGIAACRDRLLEDGVDLGAYTSAASAADLAELRLALGYDTWNLYGVGSGSRLASTILRDQPSGLRAVILDGAEPAEIDVHEALPAGIAAVADRLLANCHASQNCRTRYPDLAKKLIAAVTRAQSDPLVTTTWNPTLGRPQDIAVDADELVAELLAALQDPDAARIVPYVIDRLAGGDVAAAAPLAQRRVDVAAATSEGRDLSLACAEELPFHDAAAVGQAQDAEALTRGITTYERRVAECEVWEVPPAGEREDAAVTSNVPTLLITGEYDPRAAWSASAAAGLERHFSYVLPATGEAAVWHGGCAAYIAGQFLQDPLLEPRSKCIDHVPATDFLTTADIDPTAATYLLDSDLRTAPRPGQIGIAIAAVLVFVGTLAYGVVYALRRRWDAPPGAVVAAVAASALNLAFVGVLALVLTMADPLVLAYGLPSASWPLLLLPFAALACAVVLIVLLVRAWMQGDGGLAHRVILTVSAIGTLGFAVWLLVRGLLTL